MSQDLNRPKRRSIRLQNFDYSGSEGYFITVNTTGGEMLLGDVLEGRIKLSEVGEIVAKTWNGLTDRFPNILLDSFIVMPNHVHGILFLNVVPGTELSAANEAGRASPAPTTVSRISLGAVIGAFKSISAIQANKILGRSGAPFWQRNYYEHVIRDDGSLDRIRQYIASNPANWAQDGENPARLVAQN